MSKLIKIFQRKSVRYSIPFLLLVVGGSFGLKQFTENRYKFRKTEILSKEEAAKYGIVKKKVTLESEFETIKNIDINNWENKRGPRPWESAPEIEELSVVKDLGNWGNCNVQFIGKLLDSDGAKYICTGIEKIPPAEIELDFSLAAQIPPRNTMIRIWGELELMDNLPLVKAKIVRVIESVDIPLYKKSLDSRRMFTPHFAPLESTEPT